MPFGNNNVDATVCANVLFGVSYLALTDEFNLGDLPELKQLVADTSELLGFVINEKISQRPDLALVYYPSKYDFFWFVSRIINLYKRQDKLSYPFDYAHENLVNAMKTKGNCFIEKRNRNFAEQFVNWQQWINFLE